jgi:hypothetical protein
MAIVSSRVPRPKIFGLGLSKTGTSSLAQALSELRYKTVHNPSDDETMLALLAGDLGCATIRRHDAICDIMFCRHFRELDRLYPGSTFILTERDIEAWHGSCRRHWGSRRIASTELWNEELIDFQVYGTVLYKHDLFQDAYESHYRAVVDYFADRPKQLLRIDICAGNGWDPLCAHLGFNVPQRPFPHVRPEPWKAPEICRRNQRTERRKRRSGTGMGGRIPL